MNKVFIMGRLTADPELRQTQNGTSVCRFTVAIDRKYIDKTTGKKETDFIACVAWRQTAETISKYFSKGYLIAVEGTIRTGSYTDKNHSDVTHYTTDVWVDNFDFCDSGNKGEKVVTAKTTAKPTAPANAVKVVEKAEKDEFLEVLMDSETPF